MHCNNSAGSCSSCERGETVFRRLLGLVLLVLDLAGRFETEVVDEGVVARDELVD